MHKPLPLFAVLLSVFCWTLAAQQTITVPIPPSTGQVMALGPDNFVYVGTTGFLYKISPSTGEILWARQIGGEWFTRPSHICFHPQKGAIVQLELDGTGAVSGHSYWSAVSLDGSSSVYHKTAATENWYGYGGCAVNSHGEIFFGNSYSSRSLPSATIGKVQPDADSFKAVYLSVNPIGHLIANPDGKTIIGKIWGIPNGSGPRTGKLVVISDTGISEIPLDSSPDRPLVFSPNGQLLYVSGSGIDGSVVFDTESWQSTFEAGLYGPPIFGQSKNSYYRPQKNGINVISLVAPYEFIRFLSNPDSRTDNKELLVIPGTNGDEDTLVISRPDSIYIWKPPPPKPRVNHLAGSVSPGQWIELGGRDLGTTAVAPSLPLPTKIGGARVLFSSGSQPVEAPIYSVSPTKLAVQVPNGILPGVAELRVETNGQASDPIQISVTAGPPVAIDTFASSSSFLPGNISSRGYFSLFGRNLTDGRTSADWLGAGFEMVGTKVLVCGRLSRMVYASPTQINFVSPSWLNPGTKCSIAVETQAGRANFAEVPVAERNLSLFQFTLFRNGLFITPLLGIMTDVNGRLLGPPSSGVTPAVVQPRLGEVVLLWANGCGVSHPDNQNTPPTGVSMVPLPRITIGGANAEVLWAGLAPYFVGLCQINVRVPLSLPQQDAGVPYQLVLDGGASYPLWVGK